MCGIVGSVQRTTTDTNARLQRTFPSALEAISKRGPDDVGCQQLQTAPWTCWLGHRRLSIIDLSPVARQPMANEDDSIWLTFNGEIYNYKSLRQQLIAQGHVFRSQSDSEVLLHGYEQWGDRLLDQINGIFAFAIYDTNKQRLFLARDPIGVKPLYYWHGGQGGMHFASQPSAILRLMDRAPEINPKALNFYLGLGYVAGRQSAFNDIYKVLPGHQLVWEQGIVRHDQYWTVSTEPKIFDLSTAKEAVLSQMTESVHSQLVSDVGVGLFLSGGIDSSAVSSFATVADPAAFTIGFEDKDADERVYARQMANYLDITYVEEVLHAEDMATLLASVVDAYDEPFYGGSAFPTFAVSRLARSHGSKVILAGDGGDELFAGYLRYDEFARRMSRRNPLLWRVLGRSKSPADQYYQLPTMAVLDDRWRRKLLIGSASFEHPSAVLEPYYQPELPPTRAARLMDLHIYLPDHILCKVDRASMANGVEVRVPLLDPKLVELSFQIDESLIYQGNERKSLMKKALADRLPDQLLTGRKKGFSIPLANWMQRQLASWGEPLVTDGSLVQRGLFRASAAKRIYNSADSRLKWLLLAAELWCRRWVDEDSSLPQMLEKAGSVAASQKRGSASNPSSGSTE